MALDPRALPGRARSLDAARAVLRERGPAAVTLDAAAARHWAGLDALLDEIADDFTLPFFADPQAPLGDWLHRELRRLADVLATPAALRLTTTLIRRDAADGSTARRDRLFGPPEQRLTAALGSTELATSLIAPVVWSSLVRGVAVGDDDLRALIARQGFSNTAT